MGIPDVLVADVVHPVCNGGNPELFEPVFKNIADDVLVEDVPGFRRLFQILPIHTIVFPIPENGITVDKQS